MKIINLLTKRHILKNKRRTLVTIIAVTLTSTLLFSLGFAFSSYQKSELKKIESSNMNYDASIKDIPFSSRDILNQNKDIKKYEYATKIYDTDHYCGKEGYGETAKEIYLQIYTISDGKKFDLIHGRMPENENEIVTSTINFSLGDTININVTDYNGNIKLKEYTVVGIYNYDYNDDKGRIVFTKDDNAINDAADTSFNIYLKNKKGAYTKLFSLAKDLNLEETYEIGEGITYINLTFNKSLLELYGNYRNYTTIAIIYISLMILLTVLSISSAFIIYNSFAISLSDRKKQIGILKSVGMTKIQIRKLIFKEAIYISLISIPLGFIISFIFVQLIINYINYIQAGVKTYVIGINLSYLTLSLIFIILTVLYSSFFPAMRASEVSPMEAIRQNKDIKYKQTKNTIFTKIFGIHGFIAKANMKRNKSKYRIAIIGSVISIVLFMSVATFTNFYEKEFSYENSVGATLSTSSPFNEVQEETKDILNSKIIDDYLFLVSKTVEFKDNFDNILTNEYKNIRSNFRLTIMVRVDDKTYNDIKKKYKIKNNNPILFNTVRINNYDNNTYKEILVFKENSVINTAICIFDEDNCTPNYELNLINEIPSKFQKFKLSSGFLLVNEEIFNSIKKDNTPDRLNIDIIANDYVKLDKEVKDFLDQSKNFYEFTDVSTENLQIIKDFKCCEIVLFMIIALFAFISITSIINTISSSMTLRKREFAVLKSVGLETKGFNKMLMLESLLLTIKTLIYGTIFSLIIVYLVQNVFNLGKEKYTYMQIFPTKYFILTVIVVFITITSTIFIQMRKLKKDNIIETIKNENI